MPKKLWLATVQHASVPGTIPALFFQSTEPSNRSIKARFADVAKPAELVIDGLFDLSHTCSKDAASLKAIEAFDDANTRAAWREAKGAGKRPARAS
jgi:hypothetical protein